MLKFLIISIYNIILVYYHLWSAYIGFYFEVILLFEYI